MAVWQFFLWFGWYSFWRGGGGKTYFNIFLKLTNMNHAEFEMCWFFPRLSVNNFTTAAKSSTNPYNILWGSGTQYITLWIQDTKLTWDLFPSWHKYFFNRILPLLSHSLWQIQQFQPTQPHRNPVALACSRLHPLASWSLQLCQASWSSHVCPTGGLRGVNILGLGL